MSPAAAGAWPGLEAYNAALADPERAILAPGLSGAKAATNPWGQPSPISGGFAFTYELRLPGGRRKALRLYHSGGPGRADAMSAAYRAVSRARAGSAVSRFLVDAAWVDPCVRAGSSTAPGVVMDWVDAPVLGPWLEAAHSDAAALERLRGELSALQAALEGEGLVHGDIQAGNLAVRDDRELVLLDYDGFRSESERPSAWERGHVHFQHPDSGTGLASGTGADRFPLLALDLGLAALAADPGLFELCEGENVVWKGEDFEDPDSSPAFARVARIPALARAAGLFAAACKGGADAVPSLAEFRAAAGLSCPGPVSATLGGKGNSAAAAAPSAAVPVGTGKLAPSLPPHPRGADSDVGAAPTRSRKPKDRAYRGQYPVLDVASLSAVARSVGDKVELVGRVVSVKESRTKYGKPYAFVNFGDWRSDSVKLIYWSEGLEAAGASAPDGSWVGRWLSATGLVDEPYENERFGNTQYSITILSGSQVRLIAEAEARRRLAPEGRTPAAGGRDDDEGQTPYDGGQTPAAGAGWGQSSNPGARAAEGWGQSSNPGANAAFVSDQFGNVYAAGSRHGGQSSNTAGAAPSSRPSAASGRPSRPSNADLLAELSGGPKATAPARAVPPRSAGPVGTPSGPSSAPPARQPEREGLPAGCAWAIVIAVAFFVMWALGQ